MSKTDGGVAVTYTGKEDPFVDRNYGTGLTFEHGQTRTVPAALAQRFLQHKDVFKRGEALAEAPKAAVPADDTAELLAEAKQAEEAAREDVESTYLLIEQVKGMDKEALRDWAKQHLKDPLPGNATLATLQKRVIDQIEMYGRP